MTSSDLVPDWALDNVYIGIQCSGHCGGHGTCISGIVCDCDDGFDGDYCVPVKKRPSFLKEDFDRKETTEFLRFREQNLKIHTVVSCQNTFTLDELIYFLPDPRAILSYA